jgi:putative protease
MKKELLAPAGSFESLKAAVNNGADAVYLSGKLFGARKYAPNFNDDELREAVDYCHLYGVKIYVTVNTIIYEDEIENVLEYLCFLYNIGVDAVIVQDLGLITLIRKYLPDLEIHASTQAHTHNIEQIKLLESLGVKRVVLARELSLEEINNLDTSLELEIFIHGALCISYSGECYFSSFLLNRSGNRGECAGLCRTPFNLLDNDKKIIDSKYLLSPKEFNTTSNFEKLKSSKAISFKIEGRMKSPEYVGYVTSIYRKLLDNDNYILSDEEIFNLKSLYNRGFTKGYLFNNTDSEFISLNSSNHQGVEIGKVALYTHDKIKIYLTHELNQGDAIRLPNNIGLYVNFLYNEKGLLINKGLKDSYIYIDNKCDLKSKGSVLLTINSKLINELKENLKKKIKIDCSIYAHIGENLNISYSDTINNVEYTGDIVSEALNSPISEIRIKEILSKLGNTPFIINKIDLDIDDNIFIPVGVLNEIRRNLIQELINKRTFINRKIELNYKNNINFKRNNDLKISAFVRNEEQLKTLLDLDVDIYVSNEKLYNKYKGQNVYLRLNRIINNFKDYQNESLLIGETGSLKYINSNKVCTDYYLNVVNSSYLNYLAGIGVKRVCLSPELSLERLNLLMNNCDNNKDVEFIIYGTLEYMIMKYNLIKNQNLNNNTNCYLEDKNKRKFRVFNDGYTHLLSDRKINLIDNINNLKSMGVNVFRLEFDNESSKEVLDIYNKVNYALLKKEQQ